MIMEPSQPSNATKSSSSTPVLQPGTPDVNETTPLDVVNHQFSKAGLTPQYKRRCKDGSLIDASEAELNVLRAQAHVASTAQALQHMKITEKTAWAIDSKELANELYSRGMIKEAMNKYMEALAATDFDAQTGNIDVLVIPVLCNLAACCIELKAYRKGVRFCDQALTYRPTCLKAHVRKGLCLVHLGEFDESMVVLSQAKRLAADEMVSIQQLVDERCAQLEEANLLKVEDSNLSKEADSNLLEQEGMKKTGADEERGRGDEDSGRGDEVSGRGDEEGHEEKEENEGGKGELTVERDGEVRVADEMLVRGSRDRHTAVGGEEENTLREGNEIGRDHNDTAIEEELQQHQQQRLQDIGANVDEEQEEEEGYEEEDDEEEEEQEEEEEGGEDEGEGDEAWKEAASVAWQLDQLRDSMRKINGYLARAQRGVSLQKQAENTQKEAMRRVFGGPVVIPITRNKTGQNRRNNSSSSSDDDEENEDEDGEEDDDDDEDENGIIEWGFRWLLAIPAWFLQLFRRLFGSPVWTTTTKTKSKDS